MPDAKDSGGNVIPFRRRRETERKRPVQRQTRASDTRSPPSVVHRVVELKKRSDTVRRAMHAVPAWITPNGVTVFRTLLVIPVIVLLRQEAYWAALAVLVASMLCDFVDGALAEARDVTSETGAFLDPLGDKVVVCGTLIATLPVLPDFFLVPVAAICGIAIILTLARVPKMVRTQQGLARPTVAATTAGKLKTIAETAALILLLGVLGAAGPGSMLLVVPFCMLCIAMALGALSLLSQLASSSP